MLQNIEKYDTIKIVSWLLAILYKTNFLTNRIGKKQQGGIFMSEKFKNGWRKVKDGVSLGIAFIPIVFLGVALATVMLLIGAVIKGAIVSVCWNIAMTTMFGFSKVTMFQAFVLAFTIGCLRANYFGSAKSEYEELKGKLFEKSKEEKMAKVVSVLLVIILEIISILIAVGVTMYSWNNILPQLLNVELVKINFWQALGFAYLFNLLFGVSKSDDKKSKKDKNSNSKDVLPEAKDDTVAEEITETEDSID